MHYLDLGGCSKQSVVWVFQILLFKLLSLWTNQQVEMRGEMATQQSLVGWDVQQQSHGFHIEPWFQHLSKKPKYCSRTGYTWEYVSAGNWMDMYSLTIKPPCTPLPLRLGAYSARSTDRSHSITLWLVHCEISAGVMLFCDTKRCRQVYTKLWSVKLGVKTVQKTSCKIIFLLKWRHLVWWPTTQTIWLIVVESENLNGSLNAEVMQNTSDLQRKQVVLRDKTIKALLQKK